MYGYSPLRLERLGVLERVIVLVVDGGRADGGDECLAASEKGIRRAQERDHGGGRVDGGLANFIFDDVEQGVDFLWRRVLFF
ncbi:MAG: hypothetical protein CMI16_12550 [Opitutaceae bacterium]|nr:hypothetical protein [Opitutaceae bacterium]